MAIWHRRLLLVLVIGLVLVGTVSAETYTGYAEYDSAPYRGSVSETWGVVHSGDGTGIYNTALTGYSYTASTATGTDTFQSLIRYYSTYNLTEDKTGIPSGSTINSVKISLYGYLKASALGKPTFTMANASPANPFSHVAGDFNKTNFILLSSNITYDEIAAQYMNFTLNTDGVQYVHDNLGGTVTFANLLTWDLDNSFEGTYASGSKASYINWYQLEQAGVDKDPFITIGWTPPPPPDTTPPESITSLAASNATCEQLNWTWTDSTSDDADQVMIYKDDVFLHNVSANQTYDLWTSLTGGNTYWFNSTTCDFTGNCNVTAWQNLSETATTCSVAPVADFTANETTVCLYDYVQFTDNSTNSPDTWFWLFGDSQDSHIQNPVHYWDTAGSYTINLTAGNDDGENTTSKTDFITAVDCTPAANFTANETSVCLGDPILFMDNSTLYPAPSIFDYLDWDFGDGNTTAGFRDDGYDLPEFTYGYAGTFNVSMEITTKYGSDLLTRNDYITVIDCVGDPDFYANETCVIGEKPVAIQFTGYCPDPTFKNHWDWGDDNTTDDTQSPEHVYEDYGTYTVSHMCWAAPNPKVFENKTDYIVIGVNGTVCADDCGNTTGNCTTCTGEGEGEEYPNYLLIGACIGLLFGYITIRRKEMI